MAFSAGFQLSLELTRVFGVVSSAASTTRALIDFARDLRISGSDIVVEEDLANIFGRGRIVRDLEDQFKKKILEHTKITPLPSECEIYLHSGPGPTVSRALREDGRRYLATVIQLSMLAWIYDRTELASLLVQSMGERFEKKVPGATANPGYEGIVNTLDACSSQTSSFNWTTYLQEARNKFQRYFPAFRPSTEDHPNTMEGLSPNIMLAAMDYLYLVQNLPEDRKMLLEGREGIIPVIVWAHHILGLTVSIRGATNEPFQFGVGTSQVIINVVENTKENASVLLLDRTMEVVLESPPDTNRRTQITPQERHPLRGFATEHLRRQLNTGITTLEDDPSYRELAQFVIAWVIVRSRTLKRDPQEPCVEPEERLTLTQSLDLWRIYDAADILFYGIQYDKKELLSYIPLLETTRHVDLAFPRTIDLHIERWEQTHPHEDPKGFRGVRFSIREMVYHLTLVLLVISHVVDVRNCTDLPLVFKHQLLVNDADFAPQLMKGEPFIFSEGTLFYLIAKMLVGSQFGSVRSGTRTHDENFLISDFGWSIFLDCVQDTDPTQVKPELLHVRRGVPTNTRTLERKSRIRDAIRPSNFARAPSVQDRGKLYRPRRVGNVVSRTEYYSSLSHEFVLSIQHEFNPDSEVRGKLREMYTAYRGLHRALWSVHTTKPCPHSHSNLEYAKLGLGVATTMLGYEWMQEYAESPAVPERICIVLVKGDARARWLAVQEACFCVSRQAMLRTDDCCENCALDAVAALPGRWILII